MLSIAICSFYQTNFLTHLRTNPLSTVTYGYDSEWHDLLTSYDGSPITYDEIGNPLSYRGSTFVWDGRQLTQATKGSETMSYVYGVNGMRLQKTYTTPTKTVTTAHSTDGAVIYADFEQTVENGETQDEYRAYFYDESGSPVGFMFHGQNYYFEKTLQSDISRIYDSEGNVVGEYLYDAWGNLLNADSLTEIAKQNPFRYRGYYFDSETGLYYLRSRYYDPQVGRFINADSQLNTDSTNGYNLFAYCENNPVSASDSDGMRAAMCITMQDGTYNKIGKVLQLPTKKDDSIRIKDSTGSLINHVEKIHETTPTAMLDLGSTFGRVGFSNTVTKQDKEPALLHSYIDVGSDATKFAFGINVGGWIGADIGCNSNVNLFVTVQVTPWIHGEVSIGLDGIGVILGFDNDSLSSDFEIFGGWGSIAIFVAPQLVVTSAEKPVSSITH